MRLITTQPLLQDLMALDPPWDVDGEAKSRISRPHSARGSLFTVTLNFLLSIVSWTSDGKEGRNRDNLIALKIPNKPEQRLSAPDRSFLVLLQGEEDRSHLHCTSPQRLQIFRHHFPTSPNWEEQQEPALAWVWR